MRGTGPSDPGARSRAALKGVKTREKNAQTKERKSAKQVAAEQRDRGSPDLQEQIGHPSVWNFGPRKDCLVDEHGRFYKQRSGDVYNFALPLKRRPLPKVAAPLRCDLIVIRDRKKKTRTTMEIIEVFSDERNSMSGMVVMAPIFEILPEIDA